MPPRSVLFSAAVVFATACLHAEDPQMLRIHWESAKTYTLETQTETTFQKPGAENPPQKMDVIQTTTLGVRTDPPSSNHLVQVTFTGVRGEISSGKDVMHYDSTKPDESNPKLGQAIGRAVGKSFVLVYDEQDRFRDSRDFSSMASAPGSVIGLSALADTRDVVNLFRKSLEIGLPPLAVSVGDTWTADETMNFPQAGDTHVAMNGKFEGIEDREGRKHAKISFEGKLSSVVKKDKPVANIEIAEGSTMSGVIFFDLERRVTSYSSYAN
ncbi:MAG: hypothetical protein JWO08_917, partial [Verrucomicrobiaceae bacterium]|nr:hypothetical protein [Verrucomicrobiaceae bacterium]